MNIDSSSSSESSDSFEWLQMTQEAIFFHERLQEEQNTSRVERSRRYIWIDRERANEHLLTDYFGDNPRYPSEYFRRRFRMRRDLFLHIVDAISNVQGDAIPKHFHYFKQRPDCRGVFGFTVLQKCTSAILQLAYGTVSDSFDEYLQMSERTSYLCLHNICKCIIDLYSAKYLRKPTLNDIQRLYHTHSNVHGFPGMLGSIDCMHWPWRNCPNAWKGQYTRGDQGCPTIMLEAVASYDLWICHVFFGVAGSNNDINVLNQSPLFDDLLENNAPECPFEVNGMTYTKGYYLADDIYPEWATFVKSFSFPTDEKRRKFKRAQESARKDAERAFGVLQSRWAIVRMPARPLSLKKIQRIIYTCIIPHNMIIEDGGYAISNANEDITVTRSRVQRTFSETCEIRRRRNKELRDKDTHLNLRHDLVEHVWSLQRN